MLDGFLTIAKFGIKWIKLKDMYENQYFHNVDIIEKTNTFKLILYAINQKLQRLFIRCAISNPLIF